VITISRLKADERYVRQPRLVLVECHVTPYVNQVNETIVSLDGLRTKRSNTNLFFLNIFYLKTFSFVF
jgi:hypothetical protein